MVCVCVCVFVSLHQVWVYHLHGHDCSAATGAVSAVVSLCLLCPHCRGVHGSHSATLASSAGDTWTDRRAAAGCGFDSLIRVGVRVGVEELAALSLSCGSACATSMRNQHAQLADKGGRGVPTALACNPNKRQGCVEVFVLLTKALKRVGRLHCPMHLRRPAYHVIRTDVPCMCGLRWPGPGILS